jgi:hypothetical protein
MRKMKGFLAVGRQNIIATDYFWIWGLFGALLAASALKLSKLPC